MNKSSDLNEIFPIRLSESAYRRIRNYVYEHSGIDLTEQKKTLIVGRLQKLLRARGFKTFEQYCAYLEADKTGQEYEELINRIATNHTYFYRENIHFDFFIAKVLPEATRELKKNNSNDLRFWCAGCSSGEEPYMMVMLMMEYFGNEYFMWNAGVLATDISTKALSEAIKGVYPDERLNQMPSVFKHKYFQKIGNNAWAVNDRVKKEVTFRRFNLMSSSFPFKKQFHAIFCRNVMIYFDQETRNRLIQKFYDITKPEGYLFVGHSESLGRGRSPYRYVMPAVYQKI
ncbi:MAG: protein-glutamate O-methyltransferase CheR [Desulfobacterales bacterium]|nr:protein-glutamate O-methyltransferase CheR [Desulfobacterales bacterium]